MGRGGGEGQRLFFFFCFENVAPDQVMQHWGEAKQYTKCICRHCAVCGITLRTKVVGDCLVCLANLHLDCARKVDFYCIGCHHAIWDLEN